MSDAGSDKDKSIGTSLAPAGEAQAGVDPFLAKASEAPASADQRPFYAKALDYSAHAAMIVGLVGFAWTVSDHVVRRPAPDASSKAAKTETKADTKTAAKTDVAAIPAQAEAKKPDEIGDLRKANQKMAAEIRNLHASLEALRTTVVRERSSGDDTRAISASVDALKSSLADARSDQANAIAQLSGKIEKLQREQRAQAVVERAQPKPDRVAVDESTTASIPAGAAKVAAPPVKKAVPTPPVKPTVLAAAEPDQRFEAGRSETGKPETAEETKPPVIQGWIVRDVYQGVALIESRRGEMEVVPGVSIPGAGVVKSIERHGSGWTVTTTKGQLAYVSMRDYRRGPGPMRDMYGSPRRYDF